MLLRKERCHLMDIAILNEGKDIGNRLIAIERRQGYNLMAIPVSFLDVTGMTELRMEGHTFNIRRWRP